MKKTFLQLTYFFRPCAGRRPAGRPAGGRTGRSESQLRDLRIRTQILRRRKLLDTDRPGTAVSDRFGQTVPRRIRQLGLLCAPGISGTIPDRNVRLRQARNDRRPHRQRLRSRRSRPNRRLPPGAPCFRPVRRAESHPATRTRQRILFRTLENGGMVGRRRRFGKPAAHRLRPGFSG